MSALAGINGDLWLSTSPSTALGSPEACTDSGDHQHYYASVHQAWDSTQSFVVQNSPDGSTWTTVSASNYVVWWPVGAIIFTAVQTNTHVRIQTGNYFALSALDGAHMWKAQYKAGTKDTTPFQASGGWAVNTATIKQASFNADCFRDDARVLKEMITGTGSINISGGIVLCQLWFNEAGGQRWQFYGLPTGVAQTDAANDVEKQTINFQVTGPLYLVTSNTFSTTTVIQM